MYFFYLFYFAFTLILFIEKDEDVVKALVGQGYYEHTYEIDECESSASGSSLNTLEVKSQKSYTRQSGGWTQIFKRKSNCGVEVVTESVGLMENSLVNVQDNLGIKCLESNHSPNRAERKKSDIRSRMLKGERDDNIALDIGLKALGYFF